MTTFAALCCFVQVECDRAFAENDLDVRPKKLPKWQPHDGPQREFFESDVDEILYGGAAGGGKALRIDEQIPTPTGWVLMGALRAGDVVIAADGTTTTVTACFDIIEQPDAWELTFDDGTTIECDADHQWVTLSDAERSARLRAEPGWREQRKAKRGGESARRAAIRAATPGKMGDKGKSLRPDLAAMNAARVHEYIDPPPERGTTKTTQQIVDTLRVAKVGRANHCIVNPGPLQLPEAELPVDPYVLGAWLGDGTSRSGDVAGIDEEVFDAIAQAGFVVAKRANRYVRGVRGLLPKLRQLGVTTPSSAPKGTPSHKHIPQTYLRASIEQRIALLQGLCDTDGHAVARKGSVEFTTTSRALRDGMVELLASLGIKPSVREGRATLRGRDISAKWRIQFWSELPCFRIARKLARQKRAGFRGCHDRRYIVAARRVPASPMRCIAVDHPSHTYLAGRAMIVTHNSMAAVALPMPWIDQRDLRVLILRRESGQLDSLVDEAKKVYKYGDDKSSRPFAPAEPKTTFVSSPHWQARFPSGALIYFDHCQGESDWEKYQGRPFQIIVFDELTHFTQQQYLEISSRCRSAIAGLPRKIRATSNPGSRGHEWVFKRWRWWLDPEAVIPGRPVRYAADGTTKLPPAAPGEVLLVKKDLETEEEVVVSEQEWEEDENGELQPLAMSRTFIPARLADNPTLVKNDKVYRLKLRQFGAVRRKQLEGGDWLVKPAAGLYFKRHMFEVVEAAPAGVLARVRYWDTAGSKKPGADWTIGVRLSISPEWVIYVEHVARLKGSPAEVLAAMKKIATHDLSPSHTRLYIEQDPAAAGLHARHHFVTELAEWAPHFIPPMGDKTVRAEPASAQAEAGNIKIIRGAWNDAFLDVLESFPDGEHDDDVDGLSGAYNEALKLARLYKPAKSRVRLLGDSDD